MTNIVVFSLLFFGFYSFGYWLGRYEGYERGYSDAWWRSRGEPTMSEYPAAAAGITEQGADDGSVPSLTLTARWWRCSTCQRPSLGLSKR